MEESEQRADPGVEQARAQPAGPFRSRNKRQDFRREPLYPPQLLDCCLWWWVSANPPELVGVESPATATVTLTKDAFSFKLDQPPYDNGGIHLVIEASEGQSNGVSRAHSKATQIMTVEEPDDTAIDIKAEYEAKNGAVSAAAPKVFFRYFFVNASTGEKSAVMMTEAKLAAAAEGGA